MNGREHKPVLWVNHSSRKALKAFPVKVGMDMGQALFLAQLGGRSGDTKVMKGFGGANVVEVIEDFDNETYRAIYTVRFPRAVIVLHVFHKKSKTGIGMTQQDKDLVANRLREAKEVYETWLASRYEQ